jgi:actin-related protein
MTTSVASAVRPGLRDNRTTSSPHTPTRFTSIGSNFSSPGSTYRQEEDAIIIELGSRYLRAGFEGESGPQCVIPFTKESSRRVGDFRAYSLGYRPSPASFEAWAKENELWRNDLGDVDLGLVEDRLERTIRELYNKYLLVDAGKARLVLVLPSLSPHPLLERVLTLLFDRWNYSTIALLPSPTMSAASAGLRSGLVVDVGWEETVATPIYEYRELRVARTSRAMKLLIGNAAAALTDFARMDTELQKGLPLDHDFVEEVVMRIATCEFEDPATSTEEQLSAQTESLSVSEPTQPQELPSGAPATVLDWPVGSSSKQAKLPISIIRNCVQATIFSSDPALNPLDDNEQTLPSLIYHSLLSLIPDIRGICMSRIIFVGGGSQIPGLSTQVLQNVQTLIDRHGWTSVRGTKITAQRQRQDLSKRAQGRADARHNVLTPPEEKDFVEARLQKQWAKHATPTVTGVLREVDSLGAWAGASLLTSLKVKGFVEIERERFLSQGLAGASRDVEGSVVPQQRGSGLGTAGAKDGGGGLGGWSLGGWA